MLAFYLFYCLLLPSVHGGREPVKLLHAALSCPLPSVAEIKHIIILIKVSRHWLNWLLQGVEREIVPAVDQRQRTILTVGAGCPRLILKTRARSGGMTAWCLLFCVLLPFCTPFRAPHAVWSVGRDISAVRTSYHYKENNLKLEACTCAMPCCHGTVHLMCVCITSHKIGYTTNSCKNVSSTILL